MRHSAGTWSGKTSEVPTFPTSLNRKIHPGIQLNSGTHFPNRVPSGNCIPFQTRILGHGFRMQKRPHDVAFNLYMFSRCLHDKPRFNTEASARRRGT